jgi:membrane protease subunit HflC
VAIFADAFGRDPDFFAFYRSMQAYQDALGDDNTSFVLSPDSEFFRYFGSSNPSGQAAALEAIEKPRGAAPAQEEPVDGAAPADPAAADDNPASATPAEDQAAADGAEQPVSSDAVVR